MNLSCEKPPHTCPFIILCIDFYTVHGPGKLQMYDLSLDIVLNPIGNLECLSM